jgi:hypothetical protein
MAIFAFRSSSETQSDGPDTESSLLRYSILHTFGLVHAFILTLIAFGLVSWFPSFHFWPLLSCILLPSISLLIGIGCAACVDYVCESHATVQSSLRKGWMPAVGVFCGSLFMLPIGAVAPLIALHGIVAWLLQVYSLRAVSAAPAAVSISSSDGLAPM